MQPGDSTSPTTGSGIHLQKPLLQVKAPAVTVRFAFDNGTTTLAGIISILFYYPVE